jgi:hypothetical protein
MAEEVSVSSTGGAMNARAALAAEPSGRRRHAFPETCRS